MAGGSSSGGIFISYRREDSRPYAARLYDALKKKSSCHVFFDIDTIDPAHRFAQKIAQALDRSDACIVLIGPKWESISLPDGRRRLDGKEPAALAGRAAEARQTLRGRGRDTR